MTAQMMSLLSRVDGLPIESIKAERVWPVAPRSSGPSRVQRERIARQSMVVHHAQTPRWAAALLAEPVDLDVHMDLADAGLL
ncbi:MAG: hypothetical protein ACR2LV_05010 [Solirubrobacteraceae bacterium]